MAQFKRVRLFTNLTTMGPDNIIYDEVWVYKLVTDNGSTKQRYRIRYQKTDNAMLAYGMSEEDSEAMNEVMSSFGPAISCVLDVWHDEGWVKCLDWMGDPLASMDLACHELNDQFKSFITCVPMKSGDFMGSTPFTPNPPRSSKKKKDFDPVKTPDKGDSKTNKPPYEDPDLDWI